MTSERLIKNMKKLIDLNGFFLRCCPYMVGIPEAWKIDDMILVSPAVFQLLTDQEDLETIFTVAGQLTLISATKEMVRALVTDQWSSVTYVDDKNLTVYFRINKSYAANEVNLH